MRFRFEQIPALCSGQYADPDRFRQKKHVAGSFPDSGRLMPNPPEGMKNPAGEKRRPGFKNILVHGAGHQRGPRSEGAAHSRFR